MQGNHNRLFSPGDLGSVLRTIPSHAQKFVRDLSDSELRSKSDEEIVGDGVATLGIEPLEIDLSKAQMRVENIEPRQSREDSWMRPRVDFEVFGYGARKIVAVTFPFKGDPALWGLRPNLGALSGPRADVNANSNGDGGTVTLIFEEHSQVADDQIKQMYDAAVESIRSMMSLQEPMLRKANEELPQTLRDVLAHRRSQLNSTESLAQKLGATLAIPMTGADLELAALDQQYGQKARDASNRGRGTERYDVFISHASEDKAKFADSLAKALTNRGLRVWYDEMVLAVGDSLRREIDKGLALSRFGIVILSPHFFEKHWTNKELDGLAAKEASGADKVVLPVWHNVSREEVAKYSLPLADKIGVPSSKGLDKVVEALLLAINKR
jgi:hypothetical protein